MAEAPQVKYLTDNDGHPSSTRLMCMFALFAAIVFGGISLLHDGARASDNGVWITFAFLGAAFGGKTVSKHLEMLPKGKP